MKPFHKTIDFILIHQVDQYKCIRHTFKREEREARREKNKSYFQKFLDSMFALRRFTKFITLTKLHDGGFMKNDILYIRCVVEL